MDFVDKKEKLAELLENYLITKLGKDKLLEFVKDLRGDADFKNKDLFNSIFADIENYIDELSSREVKQRILLIRSYID